MWVYVWLWVCYLSSSYQLMILYGLCALFTNITQFQLIRILYFSFSYQNFCICKNKTSIPSVLGVLSSPLERTHARAHTQSPWDRQYRLCSMFFPELCLSSYSFDQISCLNGQSKWFVFTTLCFKSCPDTDTTVGLFSCFIQSFQQHTRTLNQFTSFSFHFTFNLWFINLRTCRCHIIWVTDSIFELTKKEMGQKSKTKKKGEVVVIFH